ncbi:uncharacterized protein [Drosophila bipectinata]|uniref:uncharacterized protein n=1 Tax=Drosophila bipectinata TaxID=42026 RepID=UPI001C8A0FC2|nr:uncharacterized protein LOC108128950 [Drosophila bipectinata]
MYFKVETTTIDPGADILHPDDAQYIWLPISVLVGIFILAALVYAMSRTRCRCSLSCLKHRAHPRNGYINVDEEDSDVPMACGDELGESLLQGRLHIEDRRNDRINS